MVGFSKQDAERVATSTKVVEGMYKTRPKQAKLKRPLAEAFFAKITDTDGSGKYSWEAVSYDSTNEEPQDEEDWGKAEHSDDELYAVEKNWSDQVPVDTDEIVYLTFANSKANYYVFDFGSPVRTGKASGTIPASGQGKWDIRKWSGSSWQTKDELDCVNPFNATISSGYPIQCVYDNGTWVVVSAGC